MTTLAPGQSRGVNAFDKRWLHTVLGTAGLLLCFTGPVSAGAQDGNTPEKSPDEKAKEAQSPAPISTFEIEGGYRLDLRSNGKDDSYYRIVYKGRQVTGEGTPFKHVQHINLAADQTQGAGDQSRLSFRYERGTASLNGGLFDALGIQPIRLTALERLNLRGTAFVGSNEDFDNLQVALGLQTRPYRLPGFQGTQWTNWIVFGAAAQRQEATDSNAADENFGILTVRAFAGKAFGWRKVGDSKKTAKALADSILQQAPSHEAAKKVYDELLKLERAKWTNLQILFHDAYNDFKPASGQTWEQVVRELTDGFAQAVSEEPTWALYAEASGWHGFAGNSQVNNTRGLLTATTDYWFVPGNQNVFLRLRYELGHERATPDVRRNQVLLSVVGRF